MGDLNHGILLLESSMKSSALWENVSLALEEQLGVDVLRGQVGSELIGRKDLYNKGILELEPSAIHLIKDQHNGCFPGLFSRVDPYSEIPRDLREVYTRRYINYWVNFIRQHGVGLIISPVPPHRLFDFSLLVACDMLDVNYISFQTTPFDKRLFVIDRFIGKGKFIVELGLESASEDVQEVIEDDIRRRCLSHDEAIPRYEINNILKSKNRFKNLFPNIKKSFDKKYKFWSSYKLAPNIIWGGHITAVQYLLYLFKKAKEHALLESAYSRHSVCVDLERDYVYFPLHYQPEETTCPSGGVFSNQLLVIDQLLNSVPVDVPIYIKEHRSQFNRSFDGNLGREARIYEYLANHQRLKLVPIDVDQFSLIDNSKMVVTVSGTVGYEAYCRGVKAVLFGRTWLEGLSNVHVFDSNAALRDFYYDEIVFLEPREKVKEIYEILQHSICAIHDENYEALYGIPGQKDEEQLVRALRNYIEGSNVFSNF